MKTTKDKFKKQARDLNTLMLWNRGFIGMAEELCKLNDNHYDYFGILDALDNIQSFMKMDNNIVNEPLISMWLSNGDYEKKIKKTKKDLLK